MPIIPPSPTSSMGEKPQPRLDALPIELIQQILMMVPDMESLKAAVLSAPILYCSFKGIETRFIKSSLENEIGDELIHDAIAAEVSSHKTVWSAEEAEQFLAQYFARGEQPFRVALSWTLPQACSLQRLHQAVEFLRDGFVSEALLAHPVSKKQEVPPVQPLSKTEKSRIDRTLYRFQIYANLFSDWEKIPLDTGEEQRESYFFHFAPWENEQLACIHDYLSGIVKPVIQEVVPSCPDWLNWIHITCANLTSLTQRQLSRGLIHIQRFVKADTSLARCELLDARTSLGFNPSFLQEALLNSTLHQWSDPLQDFDAEDEIEYVQGPWYSDSDSGPEDAWRWAHQLVPTSDFVYSPAQEPLRRWAYVMWDRTRLDAWDVFAMRWDGRYDREAFFDERQHQRDEERRMWEERSRAMEQKRISSKPVCSDDYQFWPMETRVRVWRFAY